jgi:sodium-dependent dicarboxylate transporter 2/3/5
VRVSFFQWMLVCAPIALAFTALLVLYLRKALPPEVETLPGGTERAARERAELGPWTRAQRNTLVAFALTVSLWVLPGLIALVLGAEAPLARAVQRVLPEGVVALLGAMLLFLLPVNWKERRFTLSWNDAVNIDWGTLLLFGGGLSMGGAMFRTGLARAIGERMVRLTGVSSVWGLGYLFGAVGTVLTETTSNTAAASMVCPLAISAARAAGVAPVPPAMASALGCSMAFLLPVSTPPNAIVYGSGYVRITAMARHGGTLDLISMALQPACVVLLCRLTGVG